MNDALDDRSDPHDDLDRCVDRVIREYFDSEARPIAAAEAGTTAERSPEETAFVLPRRVGRYPVKAVIGRGGLGVVLRATDPELGREIAIKIIRPKHRDEHDIVAGFLEEARVTSQLQHPGIVPIHEVGRTADGLPFFTMKIVEGETLALLLRRRRFPHEDRLRFLRIFAQVCQAIAFAHHAGVVHRDLKPGNVMVGRFGEVQVLDWGFAVWMGRGGAGAGTRGAAKAGGGRDSARVLGTPAYMATEQARGDLDEIDTRTDVFALGATLTEILTGAPPYLAETREEVYLMATKGWQQDARERLASCGADKALVALAEQCLSPDKADRPADAASVATAVERHLTDLEQRNRELYVQAAEARAHAKDERRRRRLTVATAIAVGVALVAIASYLWRRVESEQALHAAISRARVFVEQAQAGDPGDATRWEAARAAVEQAATFAHSEVDSHPDIAELLDQVGTGEAQSERDRAFLDWLAGPRLQLAYDLRVGSEGLDTGYTEAYANWGVDVVLLDVDQAATKIRVSKIAVQMVHGLDRLVEFLCMSGNGASPKLALSRKLTAIAMAADGDPWRNRVRQAFLDDDVEFLKALSREGSLTAVPTASLDLLAGTLRVKGDQTGAVRVLRVAAQRQPGDYEVVHSLERALGKIGASSHEILWQSLRGVSLRPDSAHAWHHLADALQASGEKELAKQAYQRMADCGPDYSLAASVLTLQRGRQLLDQGYVMEAQRMFQRLVEEEPGNDSALSFLALAQMTLHDTDAAIASLRAALAIRETAERRCNLGMLLRLRGHFEEALDELVRGHELSKQRIEWKYPSGEWLELVSDLQARAALLADSGASNVPAAAEERARFALVAFLIGKPRLALRLFDDAFAGVPQPGGDGIYGPDYFDASYREFAAQAAVAIAAGVEGELADAVAGGRSDVLHRARLWLGQELDWLVKRAKATDGRVELRERLSRWLYGPAWAPVRSEANLAKQGVAGAELDAWLAFWDRVQRDLASNPEPSGEVAPTSGGNDK
jgi:eukaryotic-like serine/threonine-protein kinase